MDISFYGLMSIQDGYSRFYVILFVLLFTVTYILFIVA